MASEQATREATMAPAALAKSSTCSSGQPESKQGHEPDGWAELYGAAKANGVWQGKAVSLNSPVVGVDWWDATAYAEWQ